jgi:TfoX/Sxy family transcriptional regulator of competence genes
MSRVKIEDLKPEARELDTKEMKKLFGGAIIIDENTMSAGISLTGTSMLKGALTGNNVGILSSDILQGTTMGKF